MALTLLEGEEATDAYAENLGKSLVPNTLIALYGDLGAGKTTFVRGLVRGLGGDPEMVQSPTFIYLQQYPASWPIFHFDLYRLNTQKDFLAMGFQETFEAGGIVAIEWPERIEMLLPTPRIAIRLFTHSPTIRRISLEKL